MEHSSRRGRRYDLPVDQIDTPLVLRVIEPIWQSKTATASRLRGRIEAILDWAKGAAIVPATTRHRGM
jgi:hypothetical protein